MLPKNSCKLNPIGQNTVLFVFVYYLLGEYKVSENEKSDILFFMVAKMSPIRDFSKSIICM